MSDSVSLRPIADEDQQFLFQVYAGSRSIEMAAVPWTDDQKHDFLRFQFEAQQQHYFKEFPDAQYNVILSEGHPVGRLYVDRRPAEIRILDIAVMHEHQKRGIGSKLLRDLIEEAASLSRPVTVYVETYQPSMTLFERLGFTVRENHGASVLMEWKP